MSSRRSEQTAAGPGLAAWKLPPIVAGIALPIVGGFYIGGPGLGMAVGALAAATIVVLAVRQPPLHPIVPAPAADLRDRILVVLEGEVDEMALAESLLRRTGTGPGRAAPEIVLVAPCRQGFLDRWASNLGPGRERAQHDLVHAVAALAAAGIAATARVGDEDIVQTVEDELRSYAATELVLAGGASGNEDGEAAVRDLKERLRIPLRLARISSPGSASSSCARTGARRPSSPGSRRRGRYRRTAGLSARG
jgi:hypothetical protein